MRSESVRRVPRMLYSTYRYSWTNKLRCDGCENAPLFLPSRIDRRGGGYQAARFTPLYADRPAMKPLHNETPRSNLAHDPHQRLPHPCTVPALTPLIRLASHADNSIDPSNFPQPPSYLLPPPSTVHPPIPLPSCNKPLSRTRADNGIAVLSIPPLRILPQSSRLGVI
jgi:hypothetical protein